MFANATQVNYPHVVYPRVFYEIDETALSGAERTDNWFNLLLLFRLEINHFRDSKESIKNRLHSHSCIFIKIKNQRR